MTRSVSFRPARPEDLAACTEIWAAGIGDYYRNRLHQPWEPGDLAPLGRALAHLLSTDAALFRVATRPDGSGAEQVIGFGAANERGATWFLSMLFVQPGSQGDGIGRAILEQILPRTIGHDAVLATATDSVQAVSNALYARYGMVPRLPVFQLVGRPIGSGRLPTLPEGIRVEAFDGGGPDRPTEASDDLARTLDHVDLEVLGRIRPDDHRYLWREGRLGFVYRTEGGHPLGYGYASRAGRLGPIAVVDTDLLAPVAAHLLETLVPPGASAIWLPGDAGALYPILLGAGFRIEGFPALFCWNRPVADFSRYVPISLGLI